MNLYEVTAYQTVSAVEYPEGTIEQGLAHWTQYNRDNVGISRRYLVTLDQAISAVDSNIIGMASISLNGVEDKLLEYHELNTTVPDNTK
jgi:hypothetical protein